MNFKMQTILAAYRGSIAHGMHDPNPNGIDDIDYISCFIASENHYLGTLGEKPTVVTQVDRDDAVEYELRHFCKLASVCNPNVMSLLECRELLVTSDSGELLRKHKSMFYSKHAYNAIRGYAESQIANMNKTDFAGCYQGEKRRERYKQFGYDCKSAAHGIRIIRMGCEFLETGLWRINRQEAGDSLELLNIKNGKSTKRDVLVEFEGLKERLKKAKELTLLPDNPDLGKINDTVKYILKAEL